MPTVLKDVAGILTARPDVTESTVIEYGTEGPILAFVKSNVFCSGIELRDECGAAVGDAAKRVIVILASDLPNPADDFPDPESALESADYAYRYEPPATETEKLMVALWNDVLGRRMTGVTDDFLDLGGNSALAVRIIARIASSFGIEVEFVEFFDAMSIRGLAALIDDARSGRSASEGA